MKKILVIGSGGREHAISKKLLESPKVEKVFFAPGNGVDEDGIELVNLDLKDHDSIINFAKNSGVYFCVIGPEAPLADGLADSFLKAKFPVFGPTKSAAQLEASKDFAKTIMLKSGVPTASAETFSDQEAALSYLDIKGAPIVIKADGLAAGKGVTVALDIPSAKSAICDCLSGNRFGDSGSRVLIEDYLSGREASVMAIINNGNICMLPVSSDYKRVGDGDEGPNTGGMGAVSPTPVISESRLAEIKNKVFVPVISQLMEDGIPYTGFLYAGLMIAKDGSFKVIEFNCRLGDPETQSLLLRIDQDFFELLEMAIFAPSSLPEVVKLSPKTSLTVVLASAGYPDEVRDGMEISGVQGSYLSDVNVFHAGTRREGAKLISKGGRVLGVSALGSDLSDVVKKVYSQIESISFSGMQFRKDIGKFKEL